MLTRLITCLLLAGVLVLGCSDNQKEADRLEQEMEAMEGAATDTAADTMAPAVDTTAAQTTQQQAEPDVMPDEEPATPPDMPRRPSGSGYTVQVASAPDADYARYLVQLYRDRGYQPYVEPFDHQGTEYYRLRIGLFDSHSEAKALVKELSDKYSIKAWIDEV